MGELIVTLTQIPDCGTIGLGPWVHVRFSLRLRRGTAEAVQRSRHCGWRTLHHTLRPHFAQAVRPIAARNGRRIKNAQLSPHACGTLDRLLRVESRLPARPRRT